MSLAKDEKAKIVKKFGKSAKDTGSTATGADNIIFGSLTAVAATSAACNVLIGSRAGKCVTEGDYNVFLGNYTGATTTTGDNNIMIGRGVCASSATASTEFKIGCGSNVWIRGDSSFNIYDKDGNQLNGGGGGSGGCLKIDADHNLYSDGTCSGCNFDGSSACYNVALGQCAGKNITSGNDNFAIGYLLSLIHI